MIEWNILKKTIGAILKKCKIASFLTENKHIITYIENNIQTYEINICDQIKLELYTLNLYGLYIL